jgi:hypothetical protein
MDLTRQEYYNLHVAVVNKCRELLKKIGKDLDVSSRRAFYGLEGHFMNECSVHQVILTDITWEILQLQNLGNQNKDGLRGFNTDSLRRATNTYETKPTSSTIEIANNLYAILLIFLGVEQISDLEGYNLTTDLPDKMPFVPETKSNSRGRIIHSREISKAVEVLQEKLAECPKWLLYTYNPKYKKVVRAILNFEPGLKLKLDNPPPLYPYKGELKVEELPRRILRADLYTASQQKRLEIKFYLDIDAELPPYITGVTNGSNERNLTSGVAIMMPMKDLTVEPATLILRDVPEDIRAIFEDIRAHHIYLSIPKRRYLNASALGDIFADYLQPV